MSKIIGVDTSNIDNVNGFFVTQGGGVTAAPVTKDSGVVICPYNLAPYGPFSKAEASGYNNPINMLQVSDITGVQKLDQNTNQFSVLKTNGDLYAGCWTIPNAIGVNSTDSSDARDNGGVVLSLTGVSKVSHHFGGMFAIKTDGTLWWSGNVSSYLNNTGHGQSTSNSQYKWSQVGTDTDWVDIIADWSYPYTAIAIKGSSGSQYLYSCGYNASYATGLGTSSGTTLQWTRVKSAASTDLAESFAYIHMTYGGCLAITESGKLFSWGENQYSALGAGSSTDKPYATQVGSDTDWSKAWVNRFGSFALKTNGTLYMSTTRSTWNIEPSTTGTFTQVGTDTDYEDVALYRGTSSYNYTVFAKKNGVWYLSTSGNHDAGSWVGDTLKGPTITNTWVSVSSYMQNAPTGTIDYLLPFISVSAQAEPCVMFALS